MTNNEEPIEPITDNDSDKIILVNKDKEAIKKRLYISPHFTDAILSCGGYIFQRTQRGDEATVLSVFTSPGEDQPDDVINKFNVRQANDRKAASILGYETDHFNLVEAPFRHPGFKNYADSMFAEQTKEDLEIVDTIAELIDNYIETHGTPDSIFFPLAIGGHIDHQLVFEASQKISMKQSTIRYYEDRPHAFIPGVISSRWKSLGATPKTKNKKQPVKKGQSPFQRAPDWSNLGLPFLRNLLINNDPEGKCLEKLTDQFMQLSAAQLTSTNWQWKKKSWKRRKILLNRFDSSALIRGIQSYSTEIGDLFDTHDDVTPEMQRQIIADIYRSYVSDKVGIWFEAVWTTSIPKKK